MSVDENSLVPMAPHKGSLIKILIINNNCDLGAFIKKKYWETSP